MGPWDTRTHWRGLGYTEKTGKVTVFIQKLTDLVQKDQNQKALNILANNWHYMEQQ